MSEAHRPTAESRTIQGLVIPTLGSLAVHRVELGKNDLSARQRIVGGLIEAIDLTVPPASMYANEEGKLLDLPFNPRGTSLLWMHAPRFRFRDEIRGDALLVGAPDRDGDDTPAPADLVELLTSPEPKFVELRREGTQDWYRYERPYEDWFDAYVDALDFAGEREISDARVRLAGHGDD